MSSREESVTWKRGAVFERERTPELMCKVLGSETGGTEVVDSAIEDKTCCHHGSGTEEEVRCSRGRIRSQRMRPAGEGAESTLTEPTGFECSLTSADSLRSSSREALAKTACTGTPAGQYPSPPPFTTACGSTRASLWHPTGRMAERSTPCQ
jgi:hypothetical protein